MELKFYYCKHCGKIIAIVKETTVPTICCGDEMSELIPGSSDGPIEKHVPVIRVNGSLVTVTVGEKMHPMTDDHYIEWILLETTRGLQKKFLKPGDIPKADFIMITGERVKAAYEYCNIHNLFRSQIDGGAA